MAYTAQAQYSFTIVDELGVKAAVTLYALLDPTSTVAQIETDWQTAATDIAAISAGAVLHGKASIVLLPGGGAGVPEAGSRVEQTGVFNFTNAANPRHWGADVVALADDKIVAGKIALTDADVLAFTTLMTTPTGHTDFSNNSFIANAALADAFISFRKRRKQLRSLSYEV